MDYITYCLRIKNGYKYSAGRFKRSHTCCKQNEIMGGFVENLNWRNQITYILGENKTTSHSECISRLNWSRSHTLWWWSKSCKYVSKLICTEANHTLSEVVIRPQVDQLEDVHWKDQITYPLKAKQGQKRDQQEGVYYKNYIAYSLRTQVDQQGDLH